MSTLNRERLGQKCLGGREEEVRLAKERYDKYRLKIWERILGTFSTRVGGIEEKGSVYHGIGVSWPLNWWLSEYYDLAEKIDTNDIGPGLAEDDLALIRSEQVGRRMGLILRDAEGYGIIASISPDETNKRVGLMDWLGRKMRMYSFDVAMFTRDGRYFLGASTKARLNGRDKWTLEDNPETSMFCLMLLRFLIKDTDCGEGAGIDLERMVDLEEYLQQSRYDIMLD